jgi:hypothetical protein
METSMTLDATAAALRDEVAAAREELLRVCRRDPKRTWPAYELKAEARNGWSDGAMNIALSELIDEHLLQADGDQISLSS